MKKTIFVLALVMAVLYVFPSCGHRGNKVFDYGTLEGMNYTNTYFDFTMRLPEGWHVLNRTQLQQVHKIGATMVPNRALGDQLMKAKEVQNAPLVVAYQYEPGNAENFNPSFQAVAENLSRHPDVRNAEQYQRQVLEMFKVSGMNYYDLDVPIEDTIIGGAEFNYFKLRINYGGYDVNQEWYVTLRDDFALSFGLTYADQQQADTLYNTLSSIVFREK